VVEGDREQPAVPDAAVPPQRPEPDAAVAGEQLVRATAEVGSPPGLER
jgi:hypothetical protein